MSTDQQEDSPTTQGDHTDQFVQAQALTNWTRTYYDLGISGSTTVKRPGIMSLLTDAERLRPAVIVFYKLDRAFRNAGEQFVALRRLKKLGVKVLKVRDPNLTGATGDLVDGILGSVNEFERTLIGSRIRDHNQTMASQGYWSGGPAPYGYHYRKAVREQRGRQHTTLEQGVLERDSVEWRSATQMWSWAMGGYRKSEIARMANEAGYRRRRGGLFTTDDVSRLLANRVYAGYVPFATEAGRRHNPRHWDATDWHAGLHEPMVTIEEWLRVQAALMAPRGAHRQANKTPRTELAGLVRCLQCGGPVTSACITTHRLDSHQYTCAAADRSGAEHPAWTRTPWVVISALQSVLDAAAERIAEVPVPKASAPSPAALSDLARLKNQRRRQRDMYELGEYDDDKDEYQRRARALELRISAIEATLASAPSADAVGVIWEQLGQWDNLYAAATTVLARQRFWSLFVESVQMDSQRMTVTLRDMGPDLPRVWDVELPPPRTRRPRTSPTKRKSKAWLSRTTLCPQPRETPKL